MVTKASDGENTTWYHHVQCLHYIILRFQELFTLDTAASKPPSAV